VSPAKAAAKPKAPKKSKPRVDVLAQIRVLKRLYPGARTALDYQTPFQLLVATILSAQCTDERVNLTTPALFRKYPTAQSLARAKQRDV